MNIPVPIQTKRGEVMEKGVAIEAGVSGILGFVLGIEVESSKSLGHQNSALSFNAKVNLLSDLKFVPKEIARQFQLFAEIRNKFAHVQQVDSFARCFDVLKEQKKYFIDTFAKHLPIEEKEEIKLAVAFDFLSLNLGLWMNLILARSKYLKVQELKKSAVVEMMRTFLAGTAPKKDSDEEKYFLDQLDTLVKDIDQDKDFMSSVAEAVKVGEKNSWAH